MRSMGLGEGVHNFTSTRNRKHIWPDRTIQHFKRLHASP